MTTRIYSSRDIILFLSNITKVIYSVTYMQYKYFKFSQKEVGGEDSAKEVKQQKIYFLPLHVQLIKDLFR